MYYYHTQHWFCVVIFNFGQNGMKILGLNTLFDEGFQVKCILECFNFISRTNFHKIKYRLAKGLKIFWSLFLLYKLTDSTLHHKCEIKLKKNSFVGKND